MIVISSVSSATATSYTGLVVRVYRKGDEKSRRRRKDFAITGNRFRMTN